MVCCGAVACLFFLSKQVHHFSFSFYFLVYSPPPPFVSCFLFTSLHLFIFLPFIHVTPLPLSGFFWKIFFVYLHLGSQGAASFSFDGTRRFFSSVQVWHGERGPSKPVWYSNYFPAVISKKNRPEALILMISIYIYMFPLKKIRVFRRITVIKTASSTRSK